MWYRDLHGTHAENIATIAAFFDCSDETADEISLECSDRYQDGYLGQQYGERNAILGFDLTETVSYKLLREIEKSLNTPALVERFGGVDTSDLAQLLHDAWIDGIQRKDRVTVHLDSYTDGVCELGHSVSCEDEKCGACGTSDIQRMVMVTINDPFADLWADHDQTIDGSTWESDGSDFAYTILCDRPNLVAELREEGYKLDLSEYENRSPSVDSELT